MSTPTTSKPARVEPIAAPPAPQKRSRILGFGNAPPITLGLPGPVVVRMRANCLCCQVPLITPVSPARLCTRPPLPHVRGSSRVYTRLGYDSLAGSPGRTASGLSPSNNAVGLRSSRHMLDTPPRRHYPSPSAHPPTQGSIRGIEPHLRRRTPRQQGPAAG